MDAGRPRLELTATQILAGIAASVTAAILGSRLGVAGTVVGAALASGVSIAGGALYAHSIRAARHRVQRAVSRRRADGVVMPRSHARLAGAEGLIDAPRPGHPRSASLTEGARPARPPVDRGANGHEVPVGRTRRSSPTRSAGPTRRPWWGGLAVGMVATALVFGATLAVVTGIEVVKGSPLSGGATGGLSVLGGSRAGGSVPDPGIPARDAPAPSSAASTAAEPGTGADRPTADPIPGTGGGQGAASSTVAGPDGAPAGGSGEVTSRVGSPDPTSASGTADGSTGSDGAVAGGSRAVTASPTTDATASPSATPTAPATPVTSATSEPSATGTGTSPDPAPGTGRSTGSSAAAAAR